MIGDVGRWAADAMGERELLASTVLLFGSAVAGAVVDNIPYTAATVPVVSELVDASGGGSESPIWWAFVFGADLGGNTTAVAAGANVVVIGIAHKAGHPISFWQFTKVGLLVTFLTLVVSWVYVALRYFVLA